MTTPHASLQIEDNIHSQRLRLIYEQSYQAVFFSMAAAVIYVGIGWDVIERDKLLLWLIAVYIASLLRLFIFQNFRRKNPQGNDILNWERPYFFSLMLSSLTWGLGSLLITYDLPLQSQLVTLYFLMGMAGAALGVYSSIRYIAICAIVCVLLPATLWMLFQLHLKTFLIALTAVLFMTSAIRATRILTETLHKSFKLSSELELARDTAERLARTDTLTGLNNRRAFTELAQQRLDYCERHQHPVSLILLDLDHFKAINDRFGHNAGDSALQQLADIIKETIRSSDICGRIGGEEFAVVLSNTAAAEARLVAEKLRLNIEQSVIKTAEAQFSMTASIGVSAANESLQSLLITADKAMYSAKQSGRNQVFLHDHESTFSEPSAIH